ncbi:hypothetical protein LguiA_029784 [Lonicera macranthoides]
MKRWKTPCIITYLFSNFLLNSNMPDIYKTVYDVFWATFNPKQGILCIGYKKKFE